MRTDKSYEEFKDSIVSLFGKDYSINKTFDTILAPNPLAILCTNTNKKQLYGETIANFNSTLFCNKTNQIQTDVGICTASDPMQYWLKGKISIQALENTVKEDLRDAEHVFILQTDKFENRGGFKVTQIETMFFPKSI